MHRIVVACLFLLANFNLSNISAQTCFGSETISTQEDLDAFGAMNCQQLQGSLHISGSVSDLSPLINLRTINGYLWIAASALKNLEGLNNLDSIGEYLRIFYNDSLQSLQGLEKLRVVRDYITIQANDTLQSIEAFEELKSAYYITVADNRNLEFIGTFPKLRKVVSNITIKDGRIGNVEGFNNLLKAGSIYVGSYLTESISGFNNLDSLTSMAVTSFPNLKTVSGFTSLNYVAQELKFSSCPLLHSIPSYNQLEEIGKLNINVDELNSISDFPSLQHAGSISIIENKIPSAPAFNALQSAGTISISGEQLHDFPNLQLIDTLESLGLGGSIWIESLPDYSHINHLEIVGLGSMKRLKHIDLFNNIPGLKKVYITINDSLESIHIGQAATQMEYIEIDQNPALKSFTGFDALETIDRIHITSNAALEILPSFPNLTAVRNILQLNNVGLKEINGFQKLDSVGNHIIMPICGLYFEELPNLTSITGFDSLMHVYSIRFRGMLKLDSIEGFEKLKYIENNCFIHHTNLRSLDHFRNLQLINKGLFIWQNPLLSDVSGLDSIDMTKIERYEITDNPLLETCNTHWICNAPISAYRLFKNNGTGCNSEFDVRQSCDHIYSHVYAEVFYDLNQNGQREADEPLFPSSRVHIFPVSISIFTNQDDGITSYIPFGDYKVSSSVMDPEKWMLTTIDTFQVSLTEFAPGDTIYFGYYPLQLVRDVQSYQTSFAQICNGLSFMSNIVKNTGTTIESGILWIHLDENVKDLDLNLFDHLAGEFAGYDFEDLFPGQHINFAVNYTVPGPDEFTLGEKLHFESFVEFSPAGDTTFHAHYDPVVRCAYDPNDKLTNPSRIFDQTLLTEDLHYTIRFENTGNLEATNIMIVDTLDQNLDPNTVAITSSSHSNRLTTSIKDHILTFEFRNIYLPFYSFSDSFATQGYVSFSIKPKRPVAINTIVENRAGIYFDLNPPILTNTARNWYIRELLSPCVARAGRDTILCVDIMTGLDPYYLGDKPVTLGGTAPFEISWSANYQGHVNQYPASFFVNDTSAANPILMEHVDNPVTFYLAVTDSVGFVCHDSVRIGFSQFIMSTDAKEKHITPGDSVQLYTSVSGGIPPYTYLWSPATGLSDTTILNTWASPDTTTEYTLLVTDSMGCTIVDGFRVSVGTTGIEIPNAYYIESHIHPNPLIDHSLLNISTQINASREISFYNLLGQHVSHLESDQDKIHLSRTDFEKGIYFYQITERGKIVSAGKLLVF